MKRVEIIYAVVMVGALGAAAALPFVSHRGGTAAAPGWADFVNPGPLSAKHEFLSSRCESCHTPHNGPTADKCVACHAGGGATEGLLAKQSTRFHADVGMCSECHVEHLGQDHRPVAMVHGALVDAASKTTPSAPGTSEQILQAIAKASSTPPPHARITARELTLDCNACHANQDPHRGLLGTSCSSCHATSASAGGWTIPEFRHPSSLSTDCAQCHQAPPSHYMEHFHMVSMRVAGIEHAEVSQCFLCHKTNAWNDIKGVGWYKHH
ncbi:MAG: class III cytochrome C family protein [Phycisphaerales bacterium]|nr:class III cytochrome C family protein [Phycisphaerales bacterium]